MASKNPATPSPAPGPSPEFRPPAGESQDRDVRDYAQLLEQVNSGLRAFIAEMTTVFRFIETVSTVHSLDRIVELLLDVLKELCGFDAAALYLAPEPGEPQELKRAVRLAELEHHRGLPEIDDRIYHWVYRQGQPVIIPDHFSRHSVKSAKPWSFMIAPLATENDRLGRVEMLFRRAQGTFTQQTFSILSVLIKHALMIILNERVYEKERRTVQMYLELDLLKKDVINITTHEIRTPLTVIQGSSILLDRNDAIPEEERHQLYRKITEQCDRINQIVGEMLETSKLEDGHIRLEPESLCLSSMTREVIQNIYFDPALIRFELSFESGVNHVLADRSSLYKVLQNLIENAVKYSPNGGVITVSARNQAHTVRWQIQDTGCGISAEDQKHIFEKFFRAGSSTTRRARGLGLGLYIVKKNVELNGGTISLKSAPDQGSTFTLELPKAEYGPEAGPC